MREVFDMQTAPANNFRGGDEPASVSFNTSSGVIRFNQAATVLLGLKNNARLHFERDKHKDWFIIVGKESGYPLRINSKSKNTKSNYKQFMFGHRELTRRVLSDLDKVGTVSVPLDRTDRPGEFQLATRQAVVKRELKRKE